MKIFYLSTATSEKEFFYLDKYSRNNKTTIAGTNFDCNILKGLSQNNELHNLSYRPIPSFPNNKKIFLSKKNEILENKIKIKYSMLLNLPIIKQIIFIFNSLVELIKWNRKTNGKVVIISSRIDVFLIPCCILKKILGFKIISFVPDLQELMCQYRKDTKLVKKIINKTLNFFIKKMEKNIDGYIFLSKYMREKINIDEKKYIIIDGIFDHRKVDFIIQNKKNNIKFLASEKFTVMYAGSTNEKYGIKNLINAIKELAEIELVIFGSGDLDQYLKEITREYKNIHYFGVIEREEILKIEGKVDLLVNPRPITEEFSKYSFPSKIIEYMYSGTPVVTTKLPTIDSEFDKYLFYFDKEDCISIKNKIIELSQIDRKIMYANGQQAKKFILKNKTLKIQMEKINEFLNVVMEN